VTILGGPNAADTDEGVATQGTVSNSRSTGETVGLAALTAVLALAGAAASWFGRTRVHFGGA